MKKTFAFILSVLTLLSLCACSSAAAENSAVPTASVSASAKVSPPAAVTVPAPDKSAAPVPTEAPASSETPAPSPDASKSEVPNGAEKYINVYREDKGEYKDSVGNSYWYSYVIPMFNLDGVNVSILNEEIITKLEPIVDESLLSIKDGFSISILSIGYEAYLNGDIVSLIISIDCDTDYVTKWVWNLDVSTKEGVDGDYLFSLTDMGADGTKLSDVTAASVGKFYDENYPDRTAKPWLESFNMTMEKENLAKTQYYFDAEGQLTGIVKMHVPAGAGCYDTDVPMTR